MGAGKMLGKFNIKNRVMATVNYVVKGSSNSASIYCRFTHSRSIDIVQKTNLFINPKFWEKKQQRIKNVIAVKNRDVINKKLLQLKIDLIDSFNLDYSEGEIIDKFWLEKQLKIFFNRPKDEKKNQNHSHTIYYVDFAEWWLKEKSSTWLTSAESYMNDRTIAQYESFIELVKSFQGKSKLKLNNTNHQVLTKFVKWLSDNSYAEKTIKRHINRFKFFCNRAKQEGYTIDPTYEQRIFVPKTEQILEPILDPTEIQKIYDLKIDNEKLDSVRDNLIIACWTGLRVSDYLNKLDISNFIDDYIEITTTKTKTAVVIPVHPMVKRILIKRNGQLPNKINDSEFNKQIKIVCKKAGINKEMKGRIYSKETKRKETGVYKKYNLVTSHIGRRSFATNHFGKLSNSVIMSICGWSKEEMMLKYIKKSNREHAVQLKEYWEKTYNY